MYGCKFPKEPYKGIISVVKLLLTLTTFILNEIWHSRCALRFEHLNPNHGRSVAAINTKLKHIINTWYEFHLHHHTLEEFQKKFAIDQVLCSVKRDRLYLTLPTLK